MADSSKVIKIKDLESDLKALKELHKNCRDADIYNFDINTNQLYTKEYQNLCDEILAIESIIYNANILEKLKEQG